MKNAAVFLLLLTFLFSFKIKAAELDKLYDSENESNPKRRYYKAIKFLSMGVDGILNPEDLHLGIRVEPVLSSRFHISMVNNFQFRPFYKKSISTISNSLKMQVHEMDFLFGIGIKKDFFLGNGLGLFSSYSYAYNWAIQKGTDLNKGDFIPILDIGGFWHISGRWLFEVSYQKHGYDFDQGHKFLIGFRRNFLRRVM